MGPEKLRHIPIDPALVAYHVRRYLDSLELLSLTAEGVAAHAAAHDRAVENAGKLGSKSRIGGTTPIYISFPLSFCWSS